MWHAANQDNTEELARLLNNPDNDPNVTDIVSICCLCSMMRLGGAVETKSWLSCREGAPR